MTRVARIVGAALLIGYWTLPASAFETVVSESYCRMPNLARPLRQTVVVLDQAAVDVGSGDKISEVNRKWINAIVTLAGVQEGKPNAISAPRERLTVLVAYSDGTDLVRVFTGCPPTFSQDEITKQEKQNGGLTGELMSFIGRDFRNRMEAGQKSYRTSLLSALVQIPKLLATKQSGQDQEHGSLLNALASIGSSFELSEGVPRVVVISPMTLASARNFSDTKTAREAGFALAKTMSSDLQRAEVYVTGMSANAGHYARDFLHAFFLSLKGRLVGTSGEALPAMLDAPSTVQVFGGFIDYGGVKAPIQMRLAIDNGGNLVNSWVEVALERPVATPLTGKAVCKSQTFDACEVKGDGKEFAQSWVADVGPTPKFDQSIPFSGLRYFEFSTTAQGVKGRFYDPIVVINGQKELPFELARTVGVTF